MRQARIGHDRDDGFGRALAGSKAPTSRRDSAAMGPGLNGRWGLRDSGAMGPVGLNGQWGPWDSGRWGPWDSGELAAVGRGECSALDGESAGASLLRGPLRPRRLLAVIRMGHAGWRLPPARGCRGQTKGCRWVRCLLGWLGFSGAGQGWGMPRRGSGVRRRCWWRPGPVPRRGRPPRRAPRRRRLPDRRRGCGAS